MTNKPYQLQYVEFYLTNVCDTNCQNCNRFNNYAFTGHFKWDDHKDDYVEWSKKLDILKLCFLGGEPLTNPDLINWVIGGAALWPDARLQITTNGHFISKFAKLYAALPDIVKQNLILDVSAHSPDRKV